MQNSISKWPPDSREMPKSACRILSTDASIDAKQVHCVKKMQNTISTWPPDSQATPKNACRLFYPDASVDAKKVHFVKKMQNTISIWPLTCCLRAYKDSLQHKHAKHHW